MQKLCVKTYQQTVHKLSLPAATVTLAFLTDFHNGKEIPCFEGCCNDTEILISPSFVGSDPYSDSIMKGSKASVKIYGFDDVYGHVETYKFILN